MKLIKSLQNVKLTCPAADICIHARCKIDRKSSTTTFKAVFWKASPTMENSFFDGNAPRCYVFHQKFQKQKRFSWKNQIGTFELQRKRRFIFARIDEITEWHFLQTMISLWQFTTDHATMIISYESTCFFSHTKLISSNNLYENDRSKRKTLKLSST